MQCHACGADVRDGQKFCMECGASLRGVADVTGEVPVTQGPATPADLRPPSGAPLPPPEIAVDVGDTSSTGLADLVTASGPVTPGVPAPIVDPDATGRLPVSPPPPVRPPPPYQDPDATTQLPIVGRGEPPPTGQIPGTVPRRATTDTSATRPLAVTDNAYATDPALGAPAAAAPVWIGGDTQMPVGAQPEADRARFRLRPMLFLAVLAAAAAAVAAVATTITITTDVSAPLFEIGAWKVNDFGTANAVAGLIAAGATFLGALVWCWGARWGAGLAGGGGAALAGWAALMIGLAEWPISVAVNATGVAAGETVTVTRDVGYWAIVAAGGLGVLIFLVSLVRSGRDGHAGLDPWIAALGAISTLIAAAGPLIPRGTAELSANYTSTNVDLPTAFFAGRLAQVGLFALCGVVGFLLVRRFGLGLAIGGAVAVGWMVLTAAIADTDDPIGPIGPAYANPGAADLRPHAVTIVGMALFGFFAVVAVVMALLDSDR